LYKFLCTKLFRYKELLADGEEDNEELLDQVCYAIFVSDRYGFMQCIKCRQRLKIESGMLGRKKIQGVGAIKWARGFE
jgi:hypothetical protein